MENIVLIMRVPTEEEKNNPEVKHDLLYASTHIKFIPFVPLAD